LFVTNYFSEDQIKENEMAGAIITTQTKDNENISINNLNKKK